jgi:sugar O-acyltransferase (sialic acid O-acetyltransferase NeuD family)
MKNKPLIIFGIGQVSEILTFYLKKMERNIYAYCVDDKFYKKNFFKNKKVITTQELFKKFSPNDFNLHVAISYKKLNCIREKKYLEFKKKGYFLESFVNNKSLYNSNFKIGENSIILDANIQPYAKIFNNVYIWSGSTIGHHSHVKNHAWISSGSSIGGNSKIYEKCFLGMNTTIGHYVKIKKNCFISAGSTITKDVESNTVVLHEESKKLDYSPKDFMEIIKMK